MKYWGNWPWNPYMMEGISHKQGTDLFKTLYPKRGCKNDHFHTKSILETLVQTDMKLWDKGESLNKITKQEP